MDADASLTPDTSQTDSSDSSDSVNPIDVNPIDPFEVLRSNMINRPRRVIFNNDGDDVISGSGIATASGLLDNRTTGLENTDVDSVFYCTNRGGVASHSHRSEISEQFVRADGRYRNNITAQLTEQGTDPLQIMIDWSRDNDIEVFWSERINDRHDVANPDLFSTWKEEHPQFLMGTEAEPPSHGGWAQVDYSHPEVRALMLSIIAEVANNYDVDGIELDFFRHPTFFKSVANGGRATEAELAMMSGFVQQVREAMEEAGRSRGRPILLAIRVPDSVPMARDMGLDLELWLANGWVDLMIGSGYFRVNPWSYLVDLGQRHNVKTYAGLTDSRFNARTAPFTRRSDPSYRGRAQQAWQAGVDGIYIFNMFNQTRNFLKQIGNTDELALLQKTYFATLLARRSQSYNNPNYWVSSGLDRIQTPIVSPRDPLFISPGRSHSVQIEIGDDFPSLLAQGKTLEAALVFLADGGATIESARIGSIELIATTGVAPWTTLGIPAGALEPGINTLVLQAGETRAWHTRWSATDGKPGIPPWTNAGTETAENLVEIQGDALLIADRGTASGTFFFYQYPWRATAGLSAEVEASVRVVSGLSAMTLYDGNAQERLLLREGYIETFYSGLRYDMDTTDDFHSYRVVVRGASLEVYVDDVLRIDGPDAFTEPANGRNEVGFGGATSPSQGEALWRSVRLRSPGLVGARVYDFAVTTRVVSEE